MASRKENIAARKQLIEDLQNKPTIEAQAPVEEVKKEEVKPEPKAKKVKSEDKVPQE